MGGLMVLPDPQGRFGTVFYSIVVAVLLGAATAMWRKRAAVVHGLMRLAHVMPRPVRVWTRVIWYRIFPDWIKIGFNVRTKDGEHGLGARLQHLKTVRQPKILLVGGLYLDVTLWPVGVQILDETEHADLGQINPSPGGSARWVGLYLKRLFEHRSYFYTLIGNDGPFSKELSKSIRREGWIRRHKIATADGRGAVSVVLVQHDRSFHTTFTYPGALRSFGWESIRRSIQRTTGNGGILYISGYFRTNLREELGQTLSAISPRTVTCIDHGRFRTDDNAAAVNALRQAFADGLIDIYLCSVTEIRQLVSATGYQSGTADPTAWLCEVARSGLLPKVTVVRGEDGANATSAAMIIDGEVSRIDLPRDSRVSPSGSPGRASAFNAGFLYGLTGRPAGSVGALLGKAGASRPPAVSKTEPELYDAISHAVRLALCAWVTGH